MAKVCVVGHFGFGLKMLNGQTIKTKIITEELERQLGQKEVIKIDTHGGLSALPKIFCQLFIVFKQCGNVVILPAHNGVRIFAPMCTFFNVIFKRKLHYIVIGGWLPEFLSKRKNLANCLKKFDGVYVETKTMKETLVKMGFKNISILPNCKRLNVLLEDELVFPTGVPYRLCTFSRVMEEKGIETAVDAVNKVNEVLGYTAYSLDIYGQIQTGSEVWFEKLKGKFSKHINYCGAVEASKSVDVLKNYFALLFPTHFFTEGIPGTIIDAYAAGIPVISAKWESFTDLIDDGKTGIGYEFNDNKGLEDLLIKVAHSPKQILDMKSNCIRKAKDYLPPEAMKILSSEIQGGAVNTNCIH